MGTAVWSLGGGTDCRCGHCKTLAPVYEQLADSFMHVKDKVVVAKVNADEHRELGKRFGVTGNYLPFDFHLSIFTIAHLPVDYYVSRFSLAFVLKLVILTVKASRH